MYPDLRLDIVYENNLDTDKFARIFKTTAQSYKFYWFEAILNLARESDRDLSFGEIVDEMICDAWHTVTYYHLRLGPTIRGKAENFLERAIKTLNRNSPGLSPEPSAEELKAAIGRCGTELRRIRTSLTNCVPYKLLYPFLNAPGLEEGFNYLKHDQRTRLIEYISGLPEDLNFFYTIIDGPGLEKKVRLNPDWRKFLLENFPVIQSWVRYGKAQFLQDRNPGVPGIIYKINPEHEDLRRLDQVRTLWRKTAEVTGEPVREIYTGMEIPPESLSIDHFVPRSYISNDELWNLTPMSRALNSSKSNQLPSWDAFFKPFAESQFYLYDLIFGPGEGDFPVLRACFEKCRKNNVNAVWAAENLYVPGNTETSFKNLLSRNLKPIYDAARTQGYDTWRISQ